LFEEHAGACLNMECLAMLGMMLAVWLKNGPVLTVTGKVRCRGIAPSFRETALPMTWAGISTWSSIDGR
jgi:hypothetical protein